MILCQHMKRNLEVEFLIVVFAEVGIAITIAHSLRYTLKDAGLF